MSDMPPPTPPPGAEPEPTNWTPSRKVTAGGLVAAVWLVVILGLQEGGIQLSDGLIAAAGGAVQMAAAYFIPEKS